MKKFEKSFVHPFRTPGQFYLYDVNTNSILPVTKEIYGYFKGNCQTELGPDSLSTLKLLKESGFLKSNPIQKIEHGLTKVVEDFLATKIQGATLQVTQQCNLRCKYCIYSGDYAQRAHAPKHMSFEVAKKSIDFLVAHSSDIPRLDIGFYGGEPLLAFDLIRKIHKYALRVTEGKEVIFHVTTNATLLTEEIMDYLDKNDFGVLVSLDGPKELHNANRVFAATGKGSFETVIENIKLMQEKFPALHKRLSFNAVLDPRLDPACWNEFFVTAEEYGISQIYTSSISDHYKKTELQAKDDFFKKFKKDAFLYYLYKLGRIEKKYTSPLSEPQFLQFKATSFLTRTRTKSLPEVIHPSGPCMPGARKLFVTVDGNLYPCERVSEASDFAKIGTLDDGIDIEHVKTLLNVGKITEQECKNCWSIQLCQQCMTVADNLHGFSKEKRLKKCEDTLGYSQSLLQTFSILHEYGYKFDHDTVKYFTGELEAR